MGGNLGGKLAGRSGTRARATRRHAAAKHVNHERLRAGGVARVTQHDQARGRAAVGKDARGQRHDGAYATRGSKLAAQLGLAAHA